MSITAPWPVGLILASKRLPPPDPLFICAPILPFCSHKFTRRLSVCYHSGALFCVAPTLALQDFPNNLCWERHSSAAPERRARGTSSTLLTSFYFPQTEQSLRLISYLWPSFARGCATHEKTSHPVWWGGPGQPVLHTWAEAEGVDAPAPWLVTWKCHYEHSIIIIKTRVWLSCKWSQLFAQVCLCVFMHGSDLCACIVCFPPCLKILLWYKTKLRERFCNFLIKSHMLIIYHLASASPR